MTILILSFAITDDKTLYSKCYYLIELAIKSFLSSLSVDKYDITVDMVLVAVIYDHKSKISYHIWLKAWFLFTSYIIDFNIITKSLNRISLKWVNNSLCTGTKQWNVLETCHVIIIALDYRIKENKYCYSSIILIFTVL